MSSDKSRSKEFSELALAALREAVADALRRHRALGEPVAIWRDGKAVIIPASEIPDMGGDRGDEGSQEGSGREE